MKDFNYKCTVLKNGDKRYYKKNKSDLELKRLLDQLVLGS